MKKSRLTVPVLLAVAALALGGCADAPDESSPSASGAGGSSDFKACMVSDQGGFDDKSFNQTSFVGVTRAVAELGIQENHVQSANTADYAKNIQSMVDADCNIVIGVGFALADAVDAAAKANPEVKFAIVDSAPTEPLDNVKGLVFNTHESSFMAGYLAASLSQTGVVATYGGAAYPSVTIFMDGYAQGVDYYNQQKGTSVRLLGWDVESQDGTFVQSTDPFIDVTAGKTAAQNQVSQGADVLFPVAGNAGTGALQVAQESGGSVTAIWVDTDGCESAAQYCSTLATSVYKGMDVAVFDVIKDTLEGNFSNDNFVGTLENEGTGISPFHDYDAKISDETKAELDQIKDDIIAGKITVTSEGAA